MAKTQTERRAAARLSHVDAHGRVRMVDVSAKPDTTRVAIAEGEVRINAAARTAIRRRAVAKGDPLQTARLAGIMAAKRTADLIPLCHPLPLTSVEVDLTPHATGYRIEARVSTVGRTGVEMEALVAVSAAALTLYDMLKAIDRGMVIGPIHLSEKRGGRSGDYRRPATGGGPRATGDPEPPSGHRPPVAGRRRRRSSGSRSSIRSMP